MVVGGKPSDNSEMTFTYVRIYVQGESIFLICAQYKICLNTLPKLLRQETFPVFAVSCLSVKSLTPIIAQ